MPRPCSLPTLVFQPYYFFRTAGIGRTLMANRSERRTFIRLLTDTLAKCGAHLHFAHIDDRVMHLGLYSGDRSISATLGTFCQRYAREINSLRGEKGELFRPHARLLLVQPGRWFLLLGRYIHWISYCDSREPARSRTSWNTDALYRNRLSTRGLVTTPIFRALSKGSRVPSVQDRAYRAFFDEPPGEHIVEAFTRGSAEDARIVGDAQYVRELSQRLGLQLITRSSRKINSHDELKRVTQFLVSRFQEICDRYIPKRKARKWKRVTTIENVCSKQRAQPLPMIRGLSASYLVNHQITTLRQAERFFSCRPGTLCAARRRSYKQQFRAYFGRPFEQLLGNQESIYLG
jgi:hypothetical protein